MACGSIRIPIESESSVLVPSTSSYCIYAPDPVCRRLGNCLHYKHHTKENEVVAMPGAPSSVLAPSGKARSP